MVSLSVRLALKDTIGNLWRVIEQTGSRSERVPPGQHPCAKEGTQENCSVPLNNMFSQLLRLNKEVGKNCFRGRVNCRRGDNHGEHVRVSTGVGVLLLAGCARSVAVERVKMGDAQLACPQLLSELQKADKFRKDVEDNKVTGANTAVVLLFWPALFMTDSDATEAFPAADERKADLTKLYSEKEL